MKKNGFVSREMSDSVYLPSYTGTDVPSYNPEFDCKNTLVPEPSLVNDLCVVVSDLDDSVMFTSDVTLLFDQQRLQGLTPDNVRKYLASMAPRASVYVKDRFTDDQLLTSLKSRNIQSMSELKAWSEYILDEFVDVKTDLETLMDQAKVEAESVKTMGDTE